jgi:hypothetical protein
VLRVLLTGDYGGEEFAAAVAEMKLACELIEQPSLSLAADRLARGETPVDLAVVAQSRPGQFRAQEIEALRRAAPLAPIVALLGSWCEGEMRSGTPWPGVARVYWHQWPGRFREEIAQLAQGELGVWNQPLTATADERLLSSKFQAAPTQGVVGIVSDQCEMADWLADACRQAGLSALVFRRRPSTQVDGIDLVLWEAGLAAPSLSDDFRRLAACFVGTPVIVLLDFPRSADVQRLTKAGSAAVLAKPFSMADLIAEIVFAQRR